jgi:hypothetical protein
VHEKLADHYPVLEPGDRLQFIYIEFYIETHKQYNTTYLIFQNYDAMKIPMEKGEEYLTEKDAKDITTKAKAIQEYEKINHPFPNSKTHH